MGSINLYNRIRAFIHVPNSLGEHDYPLYKRAVKKMDGSDNYVDTDEHDWENAAARDKEWSSQIGATYSSPRNVRRLFIGVNTVVVHFWSPIVKNGVQGSSLVLKQRYRDRIEASELGAIVLHGESDKHKVTGSRSGLESLKQWSLRNLEELYFDWTAVYRAGSAKNEFFNIAIANVYRSKKIGNYAPFKEAVAKLISRNGNLDKDYPRLKRVMLIANLDKYIEDGVAYTGSGVDSVEKLADDWGYDSAFEGYIGADGVNRHGLCETFGLSPNIYEFDQLYLLDKVRDIMRSISKAKQEARSTAGLAESTGDEALGEFEQAVLMLKNYTDDKTIAKILSHLGDNDAEGLKRGLLTVTKGNQGWFENLLRSAK